MRFVFLLSSLCIALLASAQDLPRTGLNLTWQNMSFFSSSAALTDAMKQSSDWFEELAYPLDEQGYPTALGPGEVAQRALFLETVHYPAGNYTLKWEGKGSLLISTASGDDFEFGPSSAPEQAIPITEIPNDEGVLLTILETDPEDPIRNIQFFLPGYDEQSSYWTDHFIDFHAQFGVTRFAWGSGLYSPQQHWEDRSRLDDITWSDSDLFPMENNGLPFEAMVDLANEAGNDLWVCAPVRADRDFQRRLATYLRDHLDPGLRLWIEWGNEYWNCGYWGYEGCVYIEELQAENGLYRPHNYAAQALELFEDFDSVFTAAGQRGRLITVLGGQSGNSWELEESTAYIDGLGRMDEVDVMTIAPYYHGGEPVNEAYATGGLDSVFALLDTMVHHAYHQEGETGQEWAENFAVARAYNKPLVAYEGGQHLTSWVGLEPGLSALINRDERMYGHYCRYFEAWQAVDVTATFVHFADIASYNEDEAFALKEYYTQPLSEAPKLRAFLDCMATPSSTEMAPPSDAGLRVFPNPAAGQLQVYCPANSLFSHIRIVAMDGRTLLQQPVERPITRFSLRGIPGGIYWLIAEGASATQVKRFVVEP